MYNEACEDICKISYVDRISHKLQNVLLFVASTHCVPCHRADKFMPLKTKPNMRVMQGVSARTSHRIYWRFTRST